MTTDRPSTLETLFVVAEAWSRRATCPRGQAGAVIATVGGSVLSQGYNGAPRGIPHCTEEGCIIDGNHCVRSVHAEMNAIIWAARMGVSISSGMLVSTTRPCIRCTIAAIQAGIREIVYDKAYDSDDVNVMLDLCSRAGVMVYDRRALR